jgi:hypothetical protein
MAPPRATGDRQHPGPVDLAPVAVSLAVTTHGLQTPLRTAFTISALIFGAIFPLLLLEGRHPRIQVQDLV